MREGEKYMHIRKDGEPLEANSKKRQGKLKKENALLFILIIHY